MQTESKTVSTNKHRYKLGHPMHEKSAPEIKSSVWEKIPIYFKSYFDDKTGTWPGPPATNSQMNKTNLHGILFESATTLDICIKCLTGVGHQQGRLVTGKNLTWPFTPGPAERWQSGRGDPLPSVVHTTRHLLKYDQSPAPPFSSHGDSSFQHAHKGWV